MKINLDRWYYMGIAAEVSGGVTVILMIIVYMFQW